MTLPAAMLLPYAALLSVKTSSSDSNTVTAARDVDLWGEDAARENDASDAAPAEIAVRFHGQNGRAPES